MNTIRKSTLMIVLMLCVIMQACSPGLVDPVVTLPPASATTRPTDEPTVLPAQAEPVAVSATATQQPATPTPIQHLTMPDKPVYIASQVVQDCTMGYTYETGEAAQIFKPCDDWAINYLERPFQDGNLNYIPSLDIEFANFGASGLWYFGKIQVHDGSLPGDGLPVVYFFELDTNFDGRGNYLVSVENLPLTATEWTVSGVRAWQDTNNDVGSKTPVRTDATNTGDGYDKLVFDQGSGPDPDLAWARRSMNAANIIEFAFKPALLQNSNSFSWWAWALQGELAPAKFDLVDGNSDLYQMDNTCTVGFNGNPRWFPNQCSVFKPTPTLVPTASVFVCIQPPKPYEDSCWIWEAAKCKWTCYN
jgi:hypothetical protein